jgi:chromosome segregation ATPase
MVLVSEVADVIRMLADVVKNTREIVDAVNDGRKFLASRYPEAQQDFGDLIDQMQHTVEGLAEVTKLISGFRFVSDGGAIDRETADRELARFNDYVIEQKKDIANLKNRIRALKADCEKVRVLRDKLDARTETRSWGSLFGLLGAKAQQRSLELHSTLSNFYADDQRMIDLFRQTLELAENGIQDVENALGPPGMANPYNVPAAAEILGTYAVLFDAPQNELHRLADVLSETRTALRS